MISTPRLDSLTAAGTNLVYDGIRLADERMLTLKTLPGAETVEEVFLYPGLTAPDTEAWENEDPWGAFLESGNFSDGSLYLDVPVAAIRELIVQHGGEHEDQASEEPAPGAQPEGGAEAVSGLLARIADLHGAFKDGYGPDDIGRVFGRIHDEGGPYLFCVWDYATEAGFFGKSQFFTENQHGDQVELQPGVCEWLSGERETPGPVDTWEGDVFFEDIDFAATDDNHNYARDERTHA
ncbi:hypothetical protein [Streptomyces sp. NPDC001089]